MFIQEARSVNRCVHSSVLHLQQENENTVATERQLNMPTKLGLLHAFLRSEETSRKIVKKMVEQNQQLLFFSDIVDSTFSGDVGLTAKKIKQVSDGKFFDVLASFLEEAQFNVENIEGTYVSRAIVDDQSLAHVVDVILDSSIVAASSDFQRSSVQSSFPQDRDVTFESISNALGRHREVTASREILQANMMDSQVALDRSISETKDHIKKNQALLKQIKRIFVKSPVGYLALEKITFIPMGHERGDLTYSLPLAPGERVFLSHKEWSYFEREMEEIQSSTLDSLTEDVLNEKSEIANSFNAQSQLNNSLQVSASVSGGYGGVNFSSAISYSANEAHISSRNYSAKTAQDITHKAASKSKKDHKITFKVSSEHRDEDESTREITNTTQEPVRWDYHRLIKKWKVQLHRYDARMTYDIVIPEPGSFLFRKYLLLQDLERRYNRPYEVDLGPGSIMPGENDAQRKQRGFWINLCQEFGISLPLPPAEKITEEFVKVIEFEPGFTKEEGAEFLDVDSSGYLEIKLKHGYEVSTVSSKSNDLFKGSAHVAGVDEKHDLNNSQIKQVLSNDGTYHWTFYYGWAHLVKDGVHYRPQRGDTISIKVTINATRSETLLREWQLQCFEIINEKQRAKYELSKQSLREEIEDLRESLEREDPLTLRKMEREEIMKNFLRWMFGPEFKFNSGVNLASSLTDLEAYAKGSTANDEETYLKVIKQVQIIEFIQQAVEWENINYVLYPYFWGDMNRWDSKSNILHSNYYHREFLRSGAARVVITIRPGFEKAFLKFMDTLEVDYTGEGDFPYQSIAEEIRSIANTNYPYSLSANQQPEENLVAEWHEYTPTGALDIVKGEVINR